jgi:hypothetical protein
MIDVKAGFATPVGAARQTTELVRADPVAD